MKKMNLLVAVFGLLVLSSLATAQTVQLSTGFDNTLTVQAPYANPATTTSNIQDMYWINIATYPTTTPAVGPTWVLRSPQAPWLAPLANSRWISARNSAVSGSGTSASNPGYTIFRKCFCLLPGFKNPSLSFRTRADNNINMYLNTTLNPLLPPSPGQYSTGGGLTGGTTTGFRTGRNCVYAYVEDDGGLMGFDLSGSVTATGLLPTPEMGTQGSYGSCSCPGGPHGPTGLPREATDASREIEIDEKQVIQQIIKIAEARRMNRKIEQ